MEIVHFARLPRREEKEPTKLKHQFKGVLQVSAGKLERI